MGRRAGAEEAKEPAGVPQGPGRFTPPTPLGASLTALEARVEALLASHETLAARLAARERELERLRGDVERYGRERAEVRARLDALLAEVDAAVAAVGQGG